MLGCTHYCVLKEIVRKLIDVPVVSQDEVVPDKLADYLHRHPEIETKLGRNGSRRFCVTDLAPGYETLVHRLTGELVNLELVSID